jgi:hypothetical protein
MENWGLVTYRTTAVLFDEGKSDNRYKNRIAYVVAHGETFPLASCYYSEGHWSNLGLIL